MAKQVLVPPLGTTVDTVTLVAWYRAEGEVVRKGEPLFVIETDKANLDVESPASGVLRGINAAAGDELKALTVIAYIAELDEAVIAATPPIPSDGRNASEAAVPSVPRVTTERAGDRVFISPRARRIAEANHITISQVKATGPEGAIIERDVRNYLQSQAAFPVPVVLETTAVSASIPHFVGTQLDPGAGMVLGIPSPTSFTLTTEVDITPLAAWRTKLLETDTKATLSSLMLYAISRVFKTQPNLVPDTGERVQTPASLIDIGLAVAGGKEFVYPVIRGVDHKGLSQIAAEEHELQAAGGHLQTLPGEACTMRFINLGDYGIDVFTPWSNTSAWTTLGVGRIKAQRDILEGKVITRQTVWLSLTAGNQRMNALQAAQFMQTLIRYLENPTLLIGL